MECAIKKVLLRFLPTLRTQLPISNGRPSGASSDAPYLLSTPLGCRGCRLSSSPPTFECLLVNLIHSHWLFRASGVCSHSQLWWLNQDDYITLTPALRINQQPKPRLLFSIPYAKDSESPLKRRWLGLLDQSSCFQSKIGHRLDPCRVWSQLATQ